MIHPTAIIHPDAKLHSSVAVGPFVVVEGPAEIGEDCTIAAHAIIGGNVVMGKANTVGYGAVIGGDPQDFAFNPAVKSRVVIGDRNKIREYVTIHRGTHEGTDTVVGNDCFLMAGAHLAHNVHLGSRVILANNVLLAGHVIVGDHVFIGGGAVFHQHIRIGSYAICQGLSGFGKDIPPFVIAAEINGVAGLNVVGLRRNGFTVLQRAEIKSAFDLLYRSGKNVSQAILEAEKMEWTDVGRLFWSFVAAAKKRGICDWLGSRRGAGRTQVPDDR